MDAPELWWSPSLAMETGEPRDGLVYHPADGRWFRNRGGWWHAVTQVPTDIRSLVLAEPVDEKGRSESYLRGFADGRLAERAGTGYDVEEQYGLCVGDPDRGVMRAADEPPFAPELADAPIVTGESGAPAPLVVDQPVHESTLPAELEDGEGR